MEEVDRIVDKLLDLLREYGFRHSLVGVEIVNVTGYAYLSRKLDLPSLAEKIKGVYDSDHRPYLVARINSTTLIISQQGKIVVWGAKNTEQINKTLKLILDTLNQ